MGELGQIKLISVIYASIFVIIGFILANVIAKAVERVVRTKFSKHKAMIIKKFVYYLLLIIFIISALQQLGFKLSILLGAAGIFTVAISFASQTAVSNLISGIFLLFEHPFKVGDIISAKGFTGYVESIDLLSTKIKTFDNQLVRLPNEGLIKAEIVNLSYFKTRRCDLLIGVAYDTDLANAQSVLLEEAQSSEFALSDPPAKTSVAELGDSQITIKVSVWVKTENIGALKAQLQQKIKARLDEEQIDIPFPQLTVHKA